MPFKARVLQLHRWLALVFALPLAVLIVTGLILSVEPMLSTASIKPGSVTLTTVEKALATADPEAKTRSIAIRAYEGTMSIGGRGDSIEVDLASGAPASDGAVRLSQFFRTTRVLHEAFMIDGRLAVLISTWALIGMIALGLLLGFSRIQNSLSGWHKAAAWFLLPLLILSPVSGLLLGYGVTFQPAASLPGPRQGERAGPPMKLVDAVRLVAAQHDLSSVIWIRPRGEGYMARINDGGVYKLAAVTPAGPKGMPTNWPRSLHEGNWGGYLSAGLNLVTSLGFVVLFVTGFTIWARRQLRIGARPRAARAQQA